MTSGKLGGNFGRLVLSGPPVACEDNPCDPTCRNFLEAPAEGLVAELDPSGATTRMDATLVWRGGTTLDLPPELLGGVCYGADDCGYGQTCGNVATRPACAHDKCDEGAALAASCDPCVEDVCRVDPTCCTYGCGAGELAGPAGEGCYYPVLDATLGWAAAQAACRARGMGWDVVAVNSPAESAWLASFGAATVWIGLNDRDGSGEWHWSNGDDVTEIGGLDATPPANADDSCVAADPAAGAWAAGSCRQSLPYVCEGPSSPPMTCSHDPCAQGVPLDAECDPCVAQVCASAPACCTEAWDADCVQLAEASCQRECGCPPGSVTLPVTGPRSCVATGSGTASYPAARARCQAIGPGWDLAMIRTEAEDNFIAAQLAVVSPVWIGLSDEDEDGAPVWVDGTELDAAPLGMGWSLGPEEPGARCVRQSAAGSWVYAPCEDPSAFACEGPPTATRSWSAACVELVESTCAATCDASQPATAARCVPWSPGQTVGSCQGFDLIPGIACANTLPVCNQGNDEVPAGVKLVHFPAGSADTSTCAPETTGGVTCATREPIPPGRCIAVTDCPDLDGAKDVLINPEGDAHVDECTCDNNWTRYVPDLACLAEPLCFTARTGRTAHSESAHVFFVVERSSALAEDGAVGWAQVTSGLGALFASPEAAGVNAALEFFPSAASGTDDDGCFGDGSCSQAVYDCANPSVSADELAAAGAAGDAQEAALLGALSSTRPSGQASVSAALEGALTRMRDAALENPADTYAVVLVGTGLSDACAAGTDDLVALADHYYREWGILTYTVAVHGANDDVMTAVAEAGGTGTSHHFTGGDASLVGLALLEELIDGTGAVPSCTLAISAPDNSDPKRALVRYVHGDGSASMLSQVSDASRCHSKGWYFDDSNAPALLTLCPAACSLVQADAGSEVHVGFPCFGDPAPALHRTALTEVYESDCPEGTQVQWGFLGYSASTPRDSRIVLSARAAAHVEDLSSVDMLNLETISAASDNEECELAAGCYIDLWDVLGGTPGAQQRVLELGVSLVPSKYNETPVLSDWQITYSCPAAE